MIVEQLSENISSKITYPLANYLDSFDDYDNLRELLDLTHPYKIHNKVVEGANDFISEFGQITSYDTDNAIKRTVQELEEFADKLNEIWQPLDNYERNEVWYSLNESMTSDETWTGAAIGALFGGIGAFVSAWIGASAAEEERVKNEVKEAVQYYLQGFSKCVECYQDAVQEIIVPYFLNDIANQIAKEEEEEQKAIQQQQQKVLATSYNNNSSKEEQLNLLAKLGELRKNGIISDEEFQQKKNNILSQI